MYYRLKELDIFPDRQIIELHKPACFKNKYKGTTVIIDATEIYSENLVTQKHNSSHFQLTRILIPSRHWSVLLQVALFVLFQISLVAVFLIRK